ncbi:PKD domain-containing protein [Deinococcus sp. KSM4-11]|uniref:CAP domain-containing protein n=1 Tax=Deinococcus sp. KSM4-11 TaxID=2568654 RepID=UPI0010A5702E|nr:CAP domain-containing protein [Deinococcus sp. KSM4-11]THF84951.1 PKD domain-containing protein [Deinococcus sp. KSM4-11]
MPGRPSSLFRRALLLGALACSAGAPGPGGAHGQTAADQTPFKVGYTASSEGRAPLLVTFHANIAPAYRVEWTFGDGGTANGTQVQHTYYHSGVYTMQARLLDAQGRMVSRAQSTIDVQSAGPERSELTILLGQGQVQLSAVDSVYYTPTPPRLTLDGQTVTSRPVRLSEGPHRAVTAGITQGGQVQERSVSFTAAAFTGSVVYENEVLRLTNLARAHGWNCATLREGGPALPPLRQNVTLDVAALAQSAGMAVAGYFDHVSGLDGSTPMRRVQAAGMQPSAVGENIAAGHETPAQVVDGWLRSPGHCHNIMGDYSLIGLAYVNRPGTTYVRYWTQVFASP